MNEFWSLHLPLMSILVLAAGVDLATRRIPNRLVAAGLLLGLACNGVGGIGIPLALAGAAAGLACLLPLYGIGAMGAGDVKLMAVVGTFVGPWQILGAVLLTMLAGGVLSLSAALAATSLRQVLANLRLMIFVAIAGKGSGLTLSDVPTTGRLPYALAIAAGTALQLWLAANCGWPFR